MFLSPWTNNLKNLELLELYPLALLPSFLNILQLNFLKSIYWENIFD